LSEFFKFLGRLRNTPSLDPFAGMFRRVAESRVPHLTGFDLQWRQRKNSANSPMFFVVIFVCLSRI
jgi:hypothetical protein